MRSPTVLELCAGMGGMALGLKQAGFEHVLLVERDARAAATLRANGFGAAVEEADVATVDFRAYGGGKVDLVAGGVPCTPFSVAGKRRGADDPRDLWPHAVRAVREVAPRAFLFENSAAMASATHAPHLARLVSQFESLGYTVAAHVVDAAHYGVPQHRRRLLLVGCVAGQTYQAPTPSTPPTTLREALASLGPPSSVAGHVVHGATARSYKGHTPSSLDRPAKAVVAGVHGCPGGANTVRLDDGSVRYLTPRELARVQTLPDDYVLPTTWSVAVRQLGNAAPPALVRAFAAPLLLHCSSPRMSSRIPVDSAPKTKMDVARSSTP